MICPYCGNYLNENTAFCPYCGAQQYIQYQYVQYQYAPQRRVIPSQKTNTLAIVGFIFSFFFALIGLICSILGYKEAPRCGGNGRGLAIARIVISILSMIGALIVYIIVLVAFNSIL